MFVSQARFDKLKRDNESLRRQLMVWESVGAIVNKNLDEIAKIVLTHEEIGNLIRLCHPDLHGGNELSTKMTARLLEIKALKTKL